MTKNTKIVIGLLAVAGIGYLIYKNQKDKPASSDLTPAEKSQAEQDEAALAARPEAEQRLTYAQNAKELVAMLTSPDYTELSFDGQPVTQGQSADHRQDVEARAKVAAKLTELIDQNKLATDELKTIHDFVLAKKNKYPGKKSKGELNASLRSIFHRYGIDLPETGKGTETKAKSFLGIKIPAISLGKKESIVSHQALIK